MIIPNINGKIRNCSKPPTRYTLYTSCKFIVKPSSQRIRMTADARPELQQMVDLWIYTTSHCPKFDSIYWLRLINLDINIYPPPTNSILPSEYPRIIPSPALRTTICSFQPCSSGSLWLPRPEAREKHTWNWGCNQESWGQIYIYSIP